MGMVLGLQLASPLAQHDELMSRPLHSRLRNPTEKEVSSSRLASLFSKPKTGVMRLIELARSRTSRSVRFGRRRRPIGLSVIWLRFRFLQPPSTALPLPPLMFFVSRKGSRVKNGGLSCRATQKRKEGSREGRSECGMKLAVRSFVRPFMSAAT